MSCQICSSSSNNNNNKKYIQFRTRLQDVHVSCQWCTLSQLVYQIKWQRKH